jgi:hypothetical protein
MLPTACDGQRKIHKHRMFVTEADASAYLREALESDSADERREAILRLADTRFVSSEPVVKGLTLIAETDTSASVRRAAIWGLGHSGSDRTMATLLRLLADDEYWDPAVLEAPASVRQAAIGVIVNRVAGGDDLGEYLDEVRETGTRLLADDPSRDVRVSAAQLLGYLQDQETLHALVAGLEQGDFGVVYESERSLMRMTGHTHDHDPWAWRDWLAQTEDPFADAGRLDGELRGSGRNWFQRNWDSTRRALASFKPKKK